MSFFLLAASAISAGWVARNLTLDLLTRFSKYHQTVRLKYLVGSTAPGRALEKSGRKPLPFQTTLSFLEGNLSLLFKLEFFKRYSAYVSKQTQRMNRTDLKPAQV